MKPTFRVHFSQDHPNRPGLWLCRRSNYVCTLEVTASDLERDSRDSSWLAGGEWGAALEAVDRDVVPLDRKQIQEYLDPLIANANQSAQAGVCDALQGVRLALLGESLELPKPYSELDEPKPVDPVHEGGAPASD